MTSKDVVFNLAEVCNFPNAYRYADVFHLSSYYNAYLSYGTNYYSLQIGNNLWEGAVYDSIKAIQGVSPVVGLQHTIKFRFLAAFANRWGAVEPVYSSIGLGFDSNTDGMSKSIIKLGRQYNSIPGTYSWFFSINIFSDYTTITPTEISHEYPLPTSTPHSTSYVEEYSDVNCDALMHYFEIELYTSTDPATHTDAVNYVVKMDQEVLFASLVPIKGVFCIEKPANLMIGAATSAYNGSPCWTQIKLYSWELNRC